MDGITKADRQSRILDLIRRDQIHTQNDLLESLRKHGINATQVTVSRDLHDLRIVKTDSGYQRLADARTLSLDAITREFVLAATAAQNLVVVRTTPGNAMTVAKALDNENWTEVVGTIAGDDTVLIVAGDPATARRTMQKLLKLK